jgi:hypothetical protein
LQKHQEGEELAPGEDISNQLAEIATFIASQPLVIKTFEENLKLKESSEAVSNLPASQKQVQQNLFLLEQILETT